MFRLNKIEWRFHVAEFRFDFPHILRDRSIAPRIAGARIAFPATSKLECPLLMPHSAQQQLVISWRSMDQTFKLADGYRNWTAFVNKVWGSNWCILYIAWQPTAPLRANARAHSVLNHRRRAPHVMIMTSKNISRRKTFTSLPPPPFCVRSWITWRVLLFPWRMNAHH